ncbi:MAG TPA: hypothetical protein VEX36_06030 [Thermoleophilaceae bacterium]|nr:hypothetical protein [Thermoleophilaceae bacterium]
MKADHLPPFRRDSVDPAWESHSAWKAKLVRDRETASMNQTPEQRAITRTLMERALESGADGLALTGSTARDRRTAISDLDYHVVGSRPRHHDLPDEVDIYAGDSNSFWQKLHSGEDFVQWTLRFGCILFDRGIFRAGLKAIATERLWPDPGLKLRRLPQLRDLSIRLLDMEDRDAAQDQVRATLTSASRALLLQEGIFPLARSELPAQLRAAGQPDLAAALDQVIVDQTLSLQKLRRRLATVDPVLHMADTLS